MMPTSGSRRSTSGHQAHVLNNTLYDLRATTAGARDACVRYNDYALDFTRRTKGAAARLSSTPATSTSRSRRRTA
jgi:hypothetical protein